MDSEPAFGVVDEAEVLPSFLNRDHVHEAGWVGGVGADLAIDFDEALHDDCFGLAGVEGILKTVVGDLSAPTIYRFFEDLTYRFRMNTIRGMQSRSLWGPGDGRGA